MDGNNLVSSNLSHGLSRGERHRLAADAFRLGKIRQLASQRKELVPLLSRGERHRLATDRKELVQYL